MDSQRSSGSKLTSALRSSAVAAMVCMIAGCSVFNPHVRVDKGWDLNCADKQFAGNMSCAVDYANAWRTEYYESVGNDSILRNGVGLSLIPLSALALYHGVTSTDNSHTIAALAIGGGSLYAAGTYLQSSPRQKVYLAGSQAIGCAMVATRPLLMLQKDYEALQTDLNTLQQHMMTTTNALRGTEALLAIVKAEGATSDRTSTAETEIRIAHSLLEDAGKTRADGRALASAVQSSGLTLSVAVDNIRDTVSSRVSDTEPDLASIMSAMGNLGKIAEAFKPTIPAGLSTLPDAVTIRGAARKTPSEDQLAAAVDALRVAAGQLATAMNAVGARVDAVAAANVDAGLKACTVADVDLGFSVTPDSAQQTVTAGTPFQFNVSSVTVPSATVAGAQLPELSTAVDLQNGAYVVVVSTTAKSAGTTQLVIKDGTGKQKKVYTLTVQKATTESGSQSSQSPSPAPSGQDEVDVGNIDVAKVIQEGLNLVGASKTANGSDLPINGNLANQTRAAMKEYQRQNGEKADGFVTKVQFARLSAIVKARGASPSPSPSPTAPTPETPVASPSANCPEGPANDFERSLTREIIVNLQQALGLPENARSGTLDARTRVAIEASTVPTLTRPAARCQLNNDLKRAILGEQP